MILTVNVIAEHAASGETLPAGWGSFAGAVHAKAMSLKGIAEVFGLSQDCFINCTDVTVPQSPPVHIEDSNCQAVLGGPVTLTTPTGTIMVVSKKNKPLRGETRTHFAIDDAPFRYEHFMATHEDTIERELQEEAALAKSPPKPKKGITAGELREALSGQAQTAAKDMQTTHVPSEFVLDPSWVKHVWHPAEKEQSEGRILRQGLKLGKGDAEGMEAIGQPTRNVVSWGKKAPPEPDRTTKPALRGLDLNMNNERHVYARVNAAHLEDITKC